MIVFPESINEVNENDAPKALRVIEAYIKYMCQRTEWAMGNMTKTVSAAGVSSAETYILLTALQNTVSALQSTVNSHGASISALLQSVATLGNDYSALAGRVTTLESTANALTQQVNTLASNYTALEQRVTALENNNTEGT